MKYKEEKYINRLGKMRWTESCKNYFLNEIERPDLFHRTISLIYWILKLVKHNRGNEIYEIDLGNNRDRICVYLRELEMTLEGPIAVTFEIFVKYGKKSYIVEDIELYIIGHEI